MNRVVFSGEPERLDRCLVRLCADFSRTAAKAHIEAGHVTVNGRPAKASTVVSAGDEIVWTKPQVRPFHLEAEPIELAVVYEDGDIVVVDKPRGMVVHPAPGHRSGTLVHALLHHTGGQLSDSGDPVRPGIVHRIDKDTSGLLLVVKNEFSHRRLAEAIRKHEVRRGYEAIVSGTPESALGTIDAPIGRDPSDRLKRAVREDGKPAVSHFEVAAAFARAAHLRVDLETGRTHQIRVHLAYIGLPIVGDLLYGGPPAPEMAGQALHAARLSFTHPRTGRPIALESPLPADFLALLARLES